MRPHPHINLATVTYLFGGAIDHRDSLGTKARIEPGAVNLMTAGHGIVHSERSPGDERAKGPELSGIQTWIALPENASDAQKLTELCRQLDELKVRLDEASTRWLELEEQLGSE